MAKILITGGAGFIGSHLVRGLLDRGDRVRVLDNLSTGSKANLTGLEVDFIEGDIHDATVVQESIKDVDAIFHLAAFISVAGSMEDPLTCYETNLNGSLNVLMQASQAGVRRVVLASSAAVYGESESTVAENHPLNPLSPYAASKLAMEQAAKLFSESFSLETVCLRYFNVYGPRQSPDSQYAAAVPIFIGAMFAGEAPMIFGDGSQTRDFIYVGDVVRALLLAAEQEKAKGEVMNIGGGASISILELVEVVRDLLPEAPETTFGPARIGGPAGSIGSAMRSPQTGVRSERPSGLLIGAAVL
ncbi:MAG: SDR family NAD(P)-dependent oxidoreductase, partial [Anaerolineales bacterium]|nr:SDR family NAD(P)-dependent oxidoreductase [Anaerolineales bacterium]